ncbi:MAG TPA: response regulator [bacterium]|nr:MAG: Alkaline phosphatase synthesis transcriptional regulatory protein PhoP [bacterium ADurb.Bin270]HPW45708.1 response regulator [bacterium]HQH80420.1 response regulator [bacterium]
MPKKILIIDDEVDLVETIKFRLESQGYQVETAYDGQEGLNKAKTIQPDLIILDVMMPKLDDYQVCRLLKFDVKFMHIKVLMLTARGQECDKNIGDDVRADAYMTKPFDGKVLLDKIAAMLKK